MLSSYTSIRLCSLVGTTSNYTHDNINTRLISSEEPLKQFGSINEDMNEDIFNVRNDVSGYILPPHNIYRTQKFRENEYLGG